jgi:hypothetical protein
MAKILMTAIVADIRNKLNGTVFSKNKAGAYMRTKVTPVNPRTASQQANRQDLASLSASWRGLSAVNQLSWINAAKSFPYFDIFGNSKELAGNALYVSLNKNLLAAGEAIIPAAPAPGIIPVFAISAASAVAATGVVTVTVDPAVIPEGFNMLVAATPNVSAGVRFVKNLYRTLGVFVVVGGVATVTAAYGSKFGAMAAGQTVGLKVWLVNVATGQASIATTLLITVA